MPVQIQAQLDVDTVADLLRQLSPLSIKLGDEDEDHWLRIAEPDRVKLVAGEGIRVHTVATLRWSIAGVPVTFDIQSLRVLLKPLLARSRGVDRLSMALVVEEADLKNVPGLVEKGILARVNGKLDKHPEAMGWSYGQTLSVRLALPETMQPVETFEMDAGNAELVVRDDAVVVNVALPMRFTAAMPTPKVVERRDEAQSAETSST